MPASTPVSPPAPIDPETQRARFRHAVDLLGGSRAAARALDVGERTVTRLLTGETAIHDGFLRDIAAALIRHAEACREAERQLSPAFAANLVAAQPRADGRRHRRDRAPRCRHPEIGRLASGAMGCLACGAIYDPARAGPETED